MNSETDMKLIVVVCNFGKTLASEVKIENGLVLNRQRTTATKIHADRVARP
jgi:hypothetical protein